MRDPKQLPKAHLEGSARSSTVRELADRYGVGLPALTKPRFEDFAEFGSALSAATEVLDSPEELARVCRELLEDEAREGVVYTEPMVSVHLHARRFGLPPEAVFLTMRRAFEKASAATGVSVGMMVGIDRSRSTEEAEEAARFAAGHAGDGVVSLGSQERAGMATRSMPASPAPAPSPGPPALRSSLTQVSWRVRPTCARPSSYSPQRESPTE